VRILKIHFLSTLFLICFFAINNNVVYGQFVQIESILVDACDNNASPTLEGLNEMVGFRVESLPVNVADIRVDGCPNTGTPVTANWPTANPFLGWITPGTVAYDTAVAKVARINASILNCGKLIIPIGGTNNQGLIPAGKKGMIITSYNFLPFGNDFSTLTDTLYVVFQNNPSTTTGNFTNFGAAGIRKLRLHKLSTGADEDVSYDKSLLIDQSGLHTAQDGAGVRYTDSGVATYYNDGCQAPYIPLNPDWTAPAPMCSTASVVDLSLLVTGTAGGSWTGTGVTGSNFNPSGLNGVYSITYTVGILPCQLFQSHDITVSPITTPTFTTLGPYCVGATPSALPSISTNSIAGTWSPATISTAAIGTTIYTFTPAVGQCATTTTMSVTIGTNITPTFTALGPYCVGATPDALSTTSTNSITGSWSPASINTSTSGTTIYTFTPLVGQCAIVTTMSVTVSTAITPIFTALGPYCAGATPVTLSATSTNSISGTWSPATINTAAAGTSIYTFTPAIGQCASTTTMSVTINANTIPTFTVLGPYCVGATPGILPATSINSITGSWSPATISTSASGTITYTFTPAVGQCATSTTLDIIVNPLPAADAGPDVSICPGSATTLNGNGGGTYNWSTGAMTNAITVSPASTSVYTLTVTSNGCTESDAVTVTISSNATVLLTPTNPSICTGASVLLSATGLNTYSWSPAADLSASTGSSVTASPVATTTYTVTGSDGAGCTGSATITVTVAPIAAIASSTDENCGQSNGTVTVNASGPCGGFAYLWNTPSQQTLQTVSGLPAGTYTVTINCGACVTTASATINFIPGPAVSVTASDASCGNSNGSATASVSGGTLNYSYLWSCSPAQSTPTMMNVAAGTYTVTVTDASNCSATANITIADIAGPSATVLLISDDSCNLSSGSALVNVTSGTAPYQYAWNSAPPQTAQLLTNVAAGNYTVIVTDANGCSTTASIIIATVAGPLVSVTTTNEICGQSNGTATVTATQGSGNYTYLWSTVPPQTTQTITNLASGMYTVTVDDGICSVTSSVNVNNIEGPEATMIINPKVVTTLDGLVYFSSQTTGSIVSWVWDYGDGSSGTGEASNHNYVNVGTYIVTLTVTDTYGCTLTVTDSVILKDIVTLYIPNSFTPDNDGLNDFFSPQGINIDPNSYEFEIYDRWGNLIFHTTDIDAKWNGTYMNNGQVPTECVMDVYVYRVVTKEVTSKEHFYIGKVTLLK